MTGNIKHIMYDATIDRMEKHEFDFEHGSGKERCRAEKEAFERLQEYLKKLPEEEAAFLNEYSDIRAACEADRELYLYQNGFMDGVRAFRAMLKL